MVATIRPPLTCRSDKATRDKAFKAVAAFLARDVELSQQDMDKLWKGLFYCALSEGSRCARSS